MTTETSLRLGAMVLAGCWVLSGVHLALTRERVAGIALVLAGVVAALPTVLGEGRVAPLVAAVVAGQLLAPAAVIAYGPRPASPRWPDLLALLALLAAAGWGLSTPAHPVYPATVALTVVGCHLWWRLEVLDRTVRRPLVWVVIGLAVAAVTSFAVAFSAPGDGSGADGLAIAVMAVPAVGMGIGVHRPDLVDAMAIVVEAAVLGVVGLTGLATYTIAVGLLTMAVAPPPIGLQAVIAVALAAALPRVRRLVHGTVSELVLGRRPDPMAAVVRVVERGAGDTASVLTLVREALALPYAAVRRSGEVGDQSDLASSGAPPGHERSFPLLPPGEAEAGEVLVVGLRPGELHLSRADTEVLALVARLLGQIRRADRLTAQLSESRAATRHAVEEERRRLRRELHDGLGPTLSGIAFTADAATNLTRPTDTRVRGLLERLSAEATAAVGDVRRIVYDIRPPALDQLGLRGALERVTAGLGARGVTVEVAVDDVGGLPAAVEVAAYRIAAEAVTNVMRHGRPTRARLALTRAGDTLHLLVTDDSPPSGSAWTEGVGITSMRERAEELGGSLRAGPTPQGGRVEATLPVASDGFVA